MENNTLHYTCPMHPEVTQDKPGNCSKCGMTLIKLKEETEKIASHQQHGCDSAAMGQSGHNHHAIMITDFKKRFYIVLVLTIPIMLLSHMIQHWLKLDWQFPVSQYVLFALSTIVFFYGAWPFLKDLVDEVKSRNPVMMFLLALP